MKEEDYLLDRRQTEDHLYQRISETVIIQRLEMKKQKAFKTKVKLLIGDYNFLQYLPLIFQWAIKTKKIKQCDLNLIIYLKTIGSFRLFQFRNARKQIGMYDKSTWTRLKKAGWIRLDSDKSRYNTYCLSNSAIGLINKIHEMVVMDSPFPMDYRHNALVERYKSKQDKNTMNILLEFNRLVLEKAENNP